MKVATQPPLVREPQPLATPRVRKDCSRMTGVSVGAKPEAAMLTMIPVGPLAGVSVILGVLAVTKNEAEAA